MRRLKTFPLLLPLLIAAGGALTSNFLFTGEWFARSREMAGLDWSGRQTIAGVLLAATAALAIWAFGKKDDFAPLPATTEDGTLSRLRPFVPAAISYVAALIGYLAVGETTAVHWLWLGAIAGLLVPLWREIDLRDFWPLPFWEFSVVVLILTGAFVLRYVDLTSLPYHVDNDVSIMGLFSKKMLLEGDARWIGMAPTAHQFSEHQLLAWSMRLFGASHYGLVMLSVLAGTATCGLVYVFGRLVFNRWVGLVGASLLAIDYVHIHFSRIIFGPISTFFVMLAAVWLAHGLRRANRLSFVLAGMSAGVGLLGYYSARVGPVIGVCVFAFWFWQRKQFPRIGWSCWGLALAGMFAIFGPNLVFGLLDADRFHGRGNDVILWTENAWRHLSLKYASEGNAWIVLKEQALRTWLAPFYFPDESTICYLRRPMLGVLAGVGLVLGIGFCLRRWRDVRSVGLLAWIGLTFVLGGMLTIDPPFWPHLNIAAPALAIVCAIGLERLTRRVILQLGSGAVLPVSIGMTGALLASGVQNWEVYYEFARAHAGGRIVAMREIEKLPREHRVFLISKDVKWGQETFQFFTPRVNGRDLSAAELLSAPPPIERPTTFFVFEDQDPKVLEYLKQAFPSARRQLFFSGWNAAVFTKVDVYPPGFVDTPQRQVDRPEPLWKKPGWRYLALILLVFVSLGWRALLRERRRVTRKAAKARTAAANGETALKPEVAL